MDLSLEIELTDRRNSGEPCVVHCLIFFFDVLFLFISFFFLTENLGGPDRGPEGGVQKGGSTFCLHPFLSNKRNN